LHEAARRAQFDHSVANAFVGIRDAHRDSYDREYHIAAQ
jgi:hypothetical protein